MTDTITITRKIALIPEYTTNSALTKKIYDYSIATWEDKISHYKKEVKEKDISDKDKAEAKNRISQLKNELNELVTNGTITQSMTIDYTYNLVRSAMLSESQRKNFLLSHIFSIIYKNYTEFNNMKLADKNKFIQEHMNFGYRVSGSKLGSLFNGIDISNPLGSYGLAFNQELTRKVKDAVKKGLLQGKVRLPQYKSNSPFTISKDHMCFEHGYNSLNELSQNIHKKNAKLYFNYGSDGKPTIARFRINVGNNGNREELLTTLLRLYEGTYWYCGSSIQLNKNGNKIILNLSMKIPKVETKLDEGTVVGVDLGIAIPAVCALNNDKYKRLFIGSGENILKTKTQLDHQKKRLLKQREDLQEQRKSLQIGLKYSKGGHGRKKKLKALEKLQAKEKNFVNTYCHKISREIVNFAVKNGAKYINIEDLTGYNKDDKLLRNWSYYNIQQKIEYKASRFGIEVRKVIPAYTSQVCSYCGHYEPNQRKNQSTFICDNPDCESHNSKSSINADFNAARNIAKSTLFYDKKIGEKQIKKAKEYYGIPS